MVRDEDMPKLEDDFGTFHFIDLASHGPAGDQWNLLCLADKHIEAGKAWIKLPPLFDTRTKLADSPVPQEYLTDLGLTGEETTLEAVMLLGEINPTMLF
jgi:hypothetical protein